jgi:hypothetical protein
MKGFWFTIEAVIAGVILVSFLGFLVSANLAVPEDPALLAYKTLDSLDRQGLLKENAAVGDYAAINSHVSISAFGHSVEICSAESCSGIKPSASSVWVGSYITPGKGKYNPLEVRLYLYR